MSQNTHLTKFLTLTQNFNSLQKVYDTVGQNCDYRHKIFDTLIQNCKSPHKIFVIPQKNFQNFRYFGKL